jgi:hypothetical protein
MQYPKLYHPKLISVLRRTLKNLERTTDPADDPSLAEVKASVLRALGEHEVRADLEYLPVAEGDSEQFVS